ncbi:MAG: helix-turn-helix domain-containing protein [Cetobacterium sp.]
MENLGSFIIKKREEKNITSGMLSYKTGIHRSSIHRIENNDTERINPKNLKSIAEALNVNYLTLFILAGYIDLDAITQFSEEHINSSVKIRIDEQLKAISENNQYTIPVLGYKSISSEKIDTSNPLSFTNVSAKDKNCIAFLVENNDMAPTILDSSIVFLEPNSIISNGDIGLFSLNEKIMIKRFFEKEDFIFLYSDNNPYNPVIIKNNDLYKCFGKIIKTINEINNNSI